MTTSTSRHWVRRLLAGATVVTLTGVAAPIGLASAADAAPAGLVLAQQTPGAGSGSGSGSGSGAGSGASGGSGTGSGSGSGAGSGSGSGAGSGSGSGSGAGSGSGGGAGAGSGAGAGAGSAQEQAARAAAQRAAAQKAAEKAAEKAAAEQAAQKAADEKAQAEKEAAEAAAKAQAQAEKEAAEAAAKQAEAERKAAERAAKQAAQAAAAAQKAREAWDKRGRPKKLILVRPTSVDVIADGRLVKRTPHTGTLTLPALGRITPDSFLTVEGDTAKLNAAVVVSPAQTFDISGVKNLQLGGGDSPTDAAFLYTGTGRISVDGVTVTSADENGKPLAMNAQGRPFIIVSSGGRFDATDSTLSDLGVQPTGTDKGDPGIAFNNGSTGALVRTQLLRNTTGLELTRSRNVRLDGVTTSESWSDGMLLQGDVGTTLAGVTAERNGGNGVTVTGDSTERAITGITTSGNHSYGVAASGQSKLQVNGITATGDGAGGVRINRCTDCVIRDITTKDQPIGLFMHVNTTNIALENLNLTGGRRGIVAEKTTKGMHLANSTVDGARVAGVAIGGHDIAVTGVTVKDSRTAVRVERGAGNITANGLKLSGGQDGIVTTAGTTGIAIADLVADGITNDAIRNFSPGATITGGRITGGLTGIDAEAGTTISGVNIGLSNEGIRARSTEPVSVDNVTVDAVAVGMNVATGSPVMLTNSRVHGLEAVRGAVDPAGTGNDLSLPPLNLLGAIGVPLIILALVLEAMHSMRQRRYGGLRRHLPPSLPATA
jgi:Right handed beta helix region